jgi:hypothetical protein
MADIDEDLRRARRAARAYAHVVGEMVEFLDRTKDPVYPGVEAEYEALLGREELSRAERQDALHRLGLVARSVEGEDA